MFHYRLLTILTKKKLNFFLEVVGEGGRNEEWGKEEGKLKYKTFSVEKGNKTKSFEQKIPRES